MTIEAKAVSCGYTGGQEALSALTFAIASGEMVFITGKSGAGKTTLLRMLLGLLPPTAGSLKVGGLELTHSSHRQLQQLRRKMGVVFQDLRLIRGQSALDNVAVSVRMLGVFGREVYRQATAALVAVDLEPWIHQPVEQLSWGQQQRVALARAVVRQPAILLADEPTGNLDRETAARIIDLMREQHRRGATVVVTTHDLAAIERAGGRRLHLAEGRLEEVPR